jgi:F-type H+-transporting ATPase subunit epsilon
MSLITLKIVTPIGTTYSGKAESVIVPTVSGVVTIRPRHIPLISIIKAGECIVEVGDAKQSFAVWNGIVEVLGDSENTNVTLLVDRSENAGIIDVSKAEEALRRAEELRAGVEVEDVDFARFEALIDKELNRIKIGRKYK